MLNPVAGIEKQAKLGALLIGRNLGKGGGDIGAGRIFQQINRKPHR